MNQLNFPNPKHSTRYKPSKKRLTQDQVMQLELSFISNSRLESHRKLELALELAIPPRQVSIWFQNRRARGKAQSLELDCGALRLSLETTLAENKRLEREVERLKGELKLVRDFCVPNMKVPRHVDHDFGYNNGSSSSEQDVILSTCSWVINEHLELDEFYGCNL